MYCVDFACIEIEGSRRSGAIRRTFNAAGYRSGDEKGLADGGAGVSVAGGPSSRGGTARIRPRSTASVAHGDLFTLFGPFVRGGGEAPVDPAGQPPVPVADQAHQGGDQ